MPNSFADRYRAAMRETGCCPIEAGLLGRLADHECAHGRLPGDRTAKCGCWPQENASVSSPSPGGHDRRKPHGRPPDRRWAARACTAARSATAPPGSRASSSCAHGTGSSCRPSSNARCAKRGGAARAPAPARTAPPPKRASGRPLGLPPRLRSEPPAPGPPVPHRLPPPQPRQTARAGTRKTSPGSSA